MNVNFFIITGLFFSYLILDIVFNDELWKWNTDLTVALQDNKFTGEYTIFVIFTESIYVIPIAGVAMYFFGARKIEAVLYLYMVIIGVISNAILKLIYHQARPYWVIDEIHGWGCNMEFGKPSGHAQTSVIMIVLFQQIFYKKPNWIIYVLMVIVLLLTGLSRIFLGVHSIGQILLGWLYGSYTIYLYTFFHEDFKKYTILILSYLAIEMRKQSNEIRLQSARYFITISYAFILIIGQVFLQLDARWIAQEDLELWVEKINNCSDKEYSTQSPFLFANVCYITSLAYTTVFCFIYGCSYSKGGFDQNRSNQPLSVRQQIYRIGLLLPILVILIPFIFIPMNDVYIVGFLIFIPIQVLAAIYLTLIYPQILYWTKLSRDGDFLTLQTQGYSYINDV